MSQLFPAPREKSRTYTVSLTQSIIDEIDRRSAALLLSKAAYVRLALQNQFKKEDGK